MSAPVTVMTRADRDAAVEQVVAHGATCVCGREASQFQLGCLLDDLANDPEPQPFVCGACACPCGWCDGAGSDDGEKSCRSCAGSGEASR